MKLVISKATDRLKVLAVHLSRLPRPIGRAPYVWALQGLRARVRRIQPRLQLWARNSFLTLAFRPFKSDLDVTVLWPSSDAAPPVAELRRALSEIRLIFPFLGEVNLYLEDELRAFFRWGNFFELERDPELLRALEPRANGGGSRSIDGCVFLLRMFDADRANLMRAPAIRKLKWQLHFEAVRGEVPTFVPPSWEQVLRAPERTIAEAALSLLNFSSVTEREAALESLLVYGSQLGRVVPHLMEWDQASRLLFPHQGLSGSGEFPPLQGVLGEVCLAQCAWELWGLLSQYHLSDRRVQIAEHVGSLARIVGADSETAQSLRHDLENFERILRSGGRPWSRRSPIERLQDT